jgi:hypothetical protein
MRTIISHDSMKSGRFSKTRRHYLEPIAFPKQNPRFEKPPLTNNVNLVLPLRIIVPDAVKSIEEAGKLVFHSLGDSGGIHGEETQNAVAEAMESQIVNGNSADNPSFAYHLGDVIYFNGQSEFYPTQFYDPYKYYPAPIFAIPGNHDGDTHTQKSDPADPETTLYGFMENFCAPQARHIDAYRATMTQPYIYWTLDAPLFTIIGLYSNVEGTLDARGTFEQQKWLQDQLAAAPKDRFLAVAVHHPPYSLDQSHGGSPDIASSLDHAMQATGVIPHIVLSGHVHNYQRFTRSYQGRQIPHIIDGRGGYANNAKAMHRLQKDPSGNYPPPHTQTVSEQDPELDLMFDAYDQENPGFLKITVTAAELTVEAYSVPFDGGFTNAPTDSVCVSINGNLTGATSARSESASRHHRGTHRDGRR